MKFLSRQEELILLAIWKLKNNAYGVTIRKLVSEYTKKYWSIGAIYDILDRLTEKEFISPLISEPTEKRGGKSKRLYNITKKGFAALEEVKQIQEIMWSGLPELVSE